ncbi:hypothetical protein [Nonomuraea sp. NPDC050310]|uniref:hypothetical protein n=1 Tax=unclassified Nonomuraea TaxID=2593643 RepID=UPI0033E51721
MRKIFWAVPALVLAGAAGLIYSNGRDPGPEPTAESERTSAVYDFTGEELTLEAKGAVRISVVPGPGGKVFVERALRWTGTRQQDESWQDDRLTAGFTCAENCDAAYTVTVPAGTKVRYSGTVTCKDLDCGEA